MNARCRAILLLLALLFSAAVTACDGHDDNGGDDVVTPTDAVTPTDVATYTVGAMSLLVVAGLAAVIPTLRATRVNPARAMRAD